jgi:hypothetical protein
MPDSAAVAGRRCERWVYGFAAMVVAFVLLRVVPFVGANTGRGIDSFDYRASSRFPIFSRAFLGGPRPFGYPLYLKIIRHDESVAVVGHLALSTVTWIALAFMVARATRHRTLRIVAAGVVLALGASFEAIQWDRIISSEALSTAFGVGLLAALLWLRERWTVPRLVLVGVLAFAATAVRDSNGTFFTLVGVVLVAAIVVRRVRVRMSIVAALLIATGLMASASASSGKRWEGPLKDVVTIRVLESPERATYFRDSGLPLTDAEIDAARGRCVSPKPPSACVIIENPAFYRWIHDHGRETYLKSMVRFPDTTLWEPVAHLRDSIGTRVRVEMKLAADTQERSPISHFLEAVIFVRNPLLLALWAIATLAACVFAAVQRRWGVWIVAALLVALTYPHLWLVWGGGALEVARHSLMASIQLRIGLWLSAIWLLDAYVSPAAASENATET